MQLGISTSKITSEYGAKRFNPASSHVLTHLVAFSRRCLESSSTLQQAKPLLSPVCLRCRFIINACGSLGEGNINIFLRFYRGAAVSPNRITATQPCAVQPNCQSIRGRVTGCSQVKTMCDNS